MARNEGSIAATCVFHILLLGTVECFQTVHCRPRLGVSQQTAFVPKTRANASFRLNSAVSDQVVNRIGERRDQGDCPHPTSNSFIECIRATNLAGVVDDATDGEICLRLGRKPGLVAVTGETGSGKSLLVAKLADIVTGGKVTSSLIPVGNDVEKSTAQVEMTVRVSGPYLTLFRESLKNDATTRGETEQMSSDEQAEVKLSRTLVRSNTSKGRISSVCEINGVPVTLKVMRNITGPLLAIVDASAASTALSRSSSRLAILDTGVSQELLSRARTSQRAYRLCRKYREELEKELESRTLPRSLSGDRDRQDSLLEHWVDELDVFEGRMRSFCEKVVAFPQGKSAFKLAANELSKSSWSDNDGRDGSFSSKQYAALIKFRDALSVLHSKIESARLAREALASISSPKSVVTAIERARAHLYDVTGDEESDSGIYTTTERTHDLLNTVETALQSCVSSLEDDRVGLLNVLENEVLEQPCSLEDVEAMFADWNLLSRKHGISPYSLPSCHGALRAELDGNVEAKLLLPNAIQDEETALQVFASACAELSKARQKVAEKLSTSVTNRMPALGMEGSTIEVDLQTGVRSCTDVSVYTASVGVGCDDVSFRLIHGAKAGDSKSKRGGPIESVGSSGEKARILLAIECELPGSVGASCRSQQAESGALSIPKPLTVLYDEIDAHVGGRAAVAMAEMLADQSNGGQVISITHSPSVAAVADYHLVIQKRPSRDIQGRRCLAVTASLVEDFDRRKELARMAAGDVAPEEAEKFADALLRDAETRKKTP